MTTNGKLPELGDQSYANINAQRLNTKISGELNNQNSAFLNNSKSASKP